MKMMRDVVVDTVNRAGRMGGYRRLSDAVQIGDGVNDDDSMNEVVEDHDEDDGRDRRLSLDSCGCADHMVRKTQHRFVGIHEEVVDESAAAASAEDRNYKDL